MTAEEIRGAVLKALTTIAPEVEPATIRPAVSFRDQLDLDSIDFLNFIIAVHDRLGVDVPEADYAKLSTLDGAVAYLQSKLTRSEVP